MPGISRITAFRFTTATICVGPMSLGFGLNPQDHAIGLVKNLQFMQDTSFVELTEGVTNVVVESMINKQSVKMSAEIYELTARNRAYGLRLDATSPLGVKIIGVDAVSKDPIGIHIPKAKITRGFARSHTVENFGNLSFEFEPFIPVPTDSGYDPDFTQLFSVFTPE